MMLDDLYQADNLKAAQQLVLSPLPIPRQDPSFSAWKATTAVPRGVSAGAAQSAGFFADVLGAFGQAGATTYTGDLLGGMTDQQRKETDEARRKMLEKGIDYSSDAGDLFRGVARGYAPDAETAHASERMLFDFARIGSKAIGYSLTGGPVAGAGFTGVDEALTVADDLRQQGVDLATRTKVGAVVGGVTGLGVGLPLAGKTALSTAALVAAGGPISYVAQQAAARKILADADYTKLSEQYDPLDPVGLLVSTLIPAGFGAWGLRASKTRVAAQAAEDFRAGPVPSELTPTAAATKGYVPADEHVNAARVILAVDERLKSNPFRPDDWRAYDKHEQAMARAVDQIAAGQRVQVEDVIAGPDLTAARALQDQVDAFQAERAELLPAAGEIAEPGAIRQAREELRAMEQERPATDDASIRAMAKDLQAQQSISYKAALSEAKRQTQGMVDDFGARQARLSAAIERNAAAQRAVQRIGELDQRIADVESQLGGQGQLVRFERAIDAGLLQMAEQLPRPKRTTADAPAAKAPPAPPAKPQGTDAAGAGRAPLPAAEAGPGSGAAEAKARLVEDAAQARVQQLELERPDMLVQLDGMESPRPLSEVMAAIKAEADDLKLDGELMQTAAECALLNRG